MGTKAYFMVKMEKKFNEDAYYLDAVRELEAMPEVESVEPVSGVCDLLVKVDAPIRVILVANKIATKRWVKSLHVLKIEYPETAEAPKSAAPEPQKEPAHRGK
jgi:DNA-binding Lrp family transcriptional regulator